MKKRKVKITRSAAERKNLSRKMKALWAERRKKDLAMAQASETNTAKDSPNTGPENATARGPATKEEVESLTRDFQQHLRSLGVTTVVAARRRNQRETYISVDCPTYQIVDFADDLPAFLKEALVSQMRRTNREIGQINTELTDKIFGNTGKLVAISGPGAAKAN